MTKTFNNLRQEIHNLKELEEIQNFLEDYKKEIIEKQSKEDYIKRNKKQFKPLEVSSCFYLYRKFDDDSEKLIYKRVFNIAFSESPKWFEYRTSINDFVEVRTPGQHEELEKLFESLK